MSRRNIPAAERSWSRGSVLRRLAPGHHVWTAPSGQQVFSLRTDHGRLERLEFCGPTGAALQVRPLPDRHLVLGPVDGIYRADHAQCLARCGRIDWQDPARIPPVDRPAALPAGTGTALINVIAAMAAYQGTEALRYEGPYPTAALFDTLLGSFALTQEPSSALARFTADAESLAIRGESERIAVDFVPDPHEWSWPTPDVCVQTRHGIERVYLRGRAFDRDRIGPRRLYEEDGSTRAVLELAGSPWHTALVLSADGEVLEGPHDPPPVESALCGEPLPPEALAVLTEALLARAPAALHQAVSAVLTRYPVTWADTGLDAVRPAAPGIEVHAILGERLVELDPRQSLQALATTLEPLVHRLAQQRLAILHDGD